MNKSVNKSNFNSNGQANSSDYHHPTTVAELTETNIKTILQLEDAAKKNQTTSERFAVKIARFCGSMTFVWVHVAWFGAWFIADALPGIPHFDPFPYTLLTLFVSLEVIFLTTFVLISQNQETRITERRNHLNLQINLLTEQENTKILQILRQIADKIGIEIEGDPTVEILEQATLPEMLVEQIELATEQSEETINTADVSDLSIKP